MEILFMYDKFYDVFLPQPLIWKDVVGFEGLYEVSNYGDIKSLSREVPINRSDGTIRMRKIRERIMKKRYDKYGVSCVGLSEEGTVKIWSIHNFMVDAFYPDKLYLEHKDGDYSHNSLWNIDIIDNHRCDYDHLESFSESNLTKELLKECFDYHEDGYLIWKKRPPEHFKDLHKYRVFNTTNSGVRAGYFNKRTDSKRDDFGYWRTGITLGDYLCHFKLHRLIFMWHYGYLPTVVDHEDGDQENNKISNLREGDVQKNSCNLRVNVNNTSGYKGVTHSSRINRRWRSSIVSEGKTYYLGSFSSKEEAAHAYNLAAEVLHKEFARFNEVDFKKEDFKPTSRFFRLVYPKLLEEYNKDKK